MNKQKIKNKQQTGQEGQAIVEFALVVTILLLLLLIPIDLYRVINTKMILNSAASESIAELDYEKLSNGELKNKILDSVDEHFGDKLDRSKVEIVNLKKNGPNSKEFTHHVYSSELAEEKPDAFQDQFEKRLSNYQYTEVELELAYDVKPISFWGKMFIGDSFKVNTPTYRKNVYISGYSSPDGGD